MFGQSRIKINYKFHLMVMKRPDCTNQCMFGFTVNLAKSPWHFDFVKHLSVTYVKIMVHLTMFPSIRTCMIVNVPYFELKLVVPEGGGDVWNRPYSKLMVGKVVRLQVCINPFQQAQSSFNTFPSWNTMTIQEQNSRDKRQTTTSQHSETKFEACFSA